MTELSEVSMPQKTTTSGLYSPFALYIGCVEKSSVVSLEKTNVPFSKGWRVMATNKKTRLSPCKDNLLGFLSLTEQLQKKTLPEKEKKVC